MIMMMKAAAERGALSSEHLTTFRRSSTHVLCRLPHSQTYSSEDQTLFILADVKLKQ